MDGTRDISATVWQTFINTTNTIKGAVDGSLEYYRCLLAYFVPYDFLSDAGGA